MRQARFVGALAVIAAVCLSVQVLRSAPGQDAPAAFQSFRTTSLSSSICGKGESQPIDKNDSAAGKANNRRVEFIKK
jgi:hypothetical protein